MVGPSNNMSGVGHNNNMSVVGIKSPFLSQAEEEDIFPTNSQPAAKEEVCVEVAENLGLLGLPLKRGPKFMHKMANFGTFKSKINISTN